MNPQINLLAHRKTELLLHLMQYLMIFFYFVIRLKTKHASPQALTDRQPNKHGDAANRQHLKAAFKLPDYAHARRLIFGDHQA